MPYCLSFRSSSSCGTESKNFEKSKYTASISPPLSITSVQWSNVAKSWVMHERPLIKPCWQEVSRLLLTRWSVTTSRMSCSSTFPTTEVRLTGLLFPGVWRLPFLWMGETFPTFQSIGSDSVSMDNWNSCASGSASTWRISLSTRGCILSGPGDFDGFNFSSFFSTLSAVMFKYSSCVFKYSRGVAIVVIATGLTINIEHFQATLAFTYTQT